MLPPSLKVDGSATLKFSTRELTSQEVKEIVEQQNKEGWCLFSTNPVQPTDIPKGDAETNQKTPSKRLYSVLFIQWTQEGERGEFEAFYRNEMENIINERKAKLI